MPYVRPEDREGLDEWIATSERPEGRPERNDPAYVDEATWSEYLRFVLERDEHERNDGHAPRALVDGLPDAWCHRTGWSARIIDGRWCIGMTGNLDTVHDAVLLVNRHSSDGEDERIARWVAASYNRILGIPAEETTTDDPTRSASPDDATAAPRSRREDIARIVDPTAWHDHDHYAARLRGVGVRPDRPDQARTIRESYERRIHQVVAESLRRADEIIALDPKPLDMRSPETRA